MTAKPQTGGGVQGQQMPGMGDALAARPALAGQHVENAQIFHQPIGQRDIELQDIPVGAKPAMADQIARIGQGKRFSPLAMGP